jgi:replicative DNA helicase
MKVNELIKSRIEYLNCAPLKEIVGVLTGFSNVDKKVGGFKQGELVIIGGRPGMGKSTFAIQLALQISKSSYKVLYVNLDFTQDWMADKLISQMEDICLSEIQNGNFKNNDELKIDQAVTSSEAMDLTIVQDCFNVEDLEKIVSEEAPKVLIIDFIQMLTSGLVEQKKDLTQVVKRIKRMALEKGIVIIALSQLNRNLKNREGDCRPQLQDLRCSGAIEEAASKVIMLYRPEYYDITEDCEGNSTIRLMEANMLLNKNGQKSTFSFRVNNKFTKYDVI